MPRTDGEPPSQPHANSAEEPALVVGIGASAGGINALKQFFAHVPTDSGVAYVVILHLSPDHESHLAEVLQTATRDAGDAGAASACAIEPNHVYVIPPNKQPGDGGRHAGRSRRHAARAAPLAGRHLLPRAGRRARLAARWPSCCRAPGRTARAGMKRVKEHGGLAIAQDPDEAEYGDMPRNSIATGLVDYVLPVARDPGAIRRVPRAPCAGPIDETPVARRPTTRRGAARDPHAAARRAPATTSRTTSGRRCCGGSSGACRCTASPTLAGLRAASCASTRTKPRRC